MGLRRWVKAWCRIAFLGLVFLPVAACVSNTSGLQKGGIYYTRANIWYEHSEEVYSTNYHVGQMIPFNSKVEILSKGGGRIRFKDLETGIIVTFIHVPKHSRLSADEFFKRYFSPTDCSGEFEQCTPREQKNILAGSVDYEMGKDALFMAYGNPPSHRTPNLKCDRWIYWNSRWRTCAVTFKDGKVIGYER